MSSEVNQPQISVAISPHASLPKGFKSAEFEEQADFVLRLFMAYIPEVFPLDGSEELIVRLGSSGDEGRYKRHGKKSICYAETFAFPDWKSAKEQDRRELLLEALSNMIDRVAHAFRGDRRAIKDAAKKVRSSDFQATVEQEALQKDSPEGVPVKLEVLRTVVRKGEDWLLQVRGEKGKVLKKDSIAKEVSPEAGRKRFVTSRWEGTKFMLLDHKGKTSYSYQIK